MKFRPSQDIVKSATVAGLRQLSPRSFVPMGGPNGNGRRGGDVIVEAVEG